MGLVFMPLRAWLFRSRAVAWGGWAAICSVVLALVDARLGGMHMRLAPTALAAFRTAGAAMGLGWLLAGLPRPLRPVQPLWRGKPEAVRPAQRRSAGTATPSVASTSVA